MSKVSDFFHSSLAAVSDALNPRYWDSDSDSEGFTLPAVTSSGQQVNVDKAMQESTVFACVRVISENIAQLPCHLMRQTGDQKEKAVSESLYKVLRYTPWLGAHMQAFDYWKWNVVCLLTRGFFLSKKIYRTSDNKIIGLTPMHPGHTKIKVDENGKVFFITASVLSVAAARSSGRTVKKETILFKDAFYGYYATLDGVNPITPIRYNAEIIGSAKEMREHGGMLFRNAAMPAGTITVQRKLNAAARKRLRQGWFRKYGAGNRGRVAILEEGSKYEKVSMSNADAQYLESRQYTKEEICGIFGVPTHMVSDTKQAKGWSTVEQLNLAFYSSVLSPLVTRIEDAIRLCLIPSKEWARSYANFDESQLLRADIKTRSEVHKTYKEIGVYSPNEIREDLEENPYEGGNEYGSTTTKPTEVPEPEEPEIEEDADEDDEDNE